MATPPVQTPPLVTLTAVQRAVLVACMRHETSSFSPVTAREWFLADAPFNGYKATFRQHLLALQRLGLLYRREPEIAAYHVTASAHQAFPDLGEQAQQPIDLTGRA